MNTNNFKMLSFTLKNHAYNAVYFPVYRGEFNGCNFRIIKKATPETTSIKERSCETRIPGNRYRLSVLRPSIKNLPVPYPIKYLAKISPLYFAFRLYRIRTIKTSKFHILS